MRDNEEEGVANTALGNPMWGVLSFFAGVACIAIGYPRMMRAHRFGYWDEVGAGALAIVTGVLMLVGGVYMFVKRRA